MVGGVVGIYNGKEFTNPYRTFNLELFNSFNLLRSCLQEEKK